MRILKHDELSYLHQMAADKGSHRLSVAIYARKSRDDLSGSSLARQVDLCKSLVQKNDQLLTIKTVYQEDDVSGMTLDHRGELSKLRAEVKSGAIDVVLVSHFDRLARDLVSIQTLIQEFSDYKVHLIAGDDQSDNSAAGILHKQMQFALNEFLVRRSVEDVKQTHANKVKEGYTVGGPGNYGYDVVGRKYVINEEEAYVVRRIFEWTLQGKSYHVIADDLEAQRFKPRKAKRFSPSFIKSVLTNKRNCGISVWNAKDKRKNNLGVLKEDIEEVVSEEVVKEPIISESTFNRVQSLLANRAHAKTNNQGSPYMLTGVIKCGHCGESITGNSQRNGRNKNLYRTYHCKNHKGKHGKTCPTKPVRVEYVENQIKHAIHTYLQASVQQNDIPQKTVDKLLKDKRRQETQLKKRLIDHDHKIEDLVVGYHTESNDRIKQKTKALIEQSENNKTTDQAILEDVRYNIDNVKLSVSRLIEGSFTFEMLFHDDELTRQLIHQLIKKVEVTNDKITIEFHE